VQAGQSRNLRNRLTNQPDIAYTGKVWSGAVGSTGTWTSVVGSWAVPTVSQPPELLVQETYWDSLTWVGLGGWGTSSDQLLQTGSRQNFYPSGQAPDYYGWYEWYSTPQAGSPPYIYVTKIQNFPVAPGDELTAAVQYVGNNTAGSISLINKRTGVHFSITLVPPPGISFIENSYEWIMEAPNGGESVSSLPAFTPIVFSGCGACGPNNAFANPGIADTTNIVTPAGKTLTSVTTAPDTATITFIG
jgi:hypothetical protein